MLDKDQDQKVSEGGTAIQAGGNVNIVNTGLSLAEVRDVALDVFRANFYTLAGVAQTTAEARASEITETFLSKLATEHPTGIEKANDPDFQYALLTVQREHARIGDKDLGELLVDLLVDRSKQGQRDILQIVLTESLNTAPKLTDSQLAALSIIFLFRYTRRYGVVSHQSLGEYFDKFAGPLSAKVVKNLACYQHLEFAGCGQIGLGSVSLESALGTNFHGLFSKGFDETAIAEKGLSVGLDPNFFVNCLNDPSKRQVNALGKEELQKAFEAKAVSPDDRTKLNALFDLGKMSDSEIKDKCIEVRPYMAGLFEAWSESAMKNFSLTSVGIAIGHANIKRFAGEFANLAIWIN